MMSKITAGSTSQPSTPWRRIPQYTTKINTTSSPSRTTRDAV